MPNWKKKHRLRTGTKTCFAGRNRSRCQALGHSGRRFSNYTKARNYALEIKKKASRKLADKPIDIEPVSTGAAIIYRSKITGFAKNEADAACKSLKNQTNPV